MNRLTFALIGSLALAACSKPPGPAQSPAVQLNQKTFQVRGILRAINFAAQTATIKHEEIPDYMEAMTMPFDVKSMSELEPLKAGDPITFKLVVTDTTSWIEGVKRIPGAPTEDVAPAIAKSSGSRLKEGDALPDFRLVDDQGREITRDTYAGKPLLLTFIFSRCPLPNYCPQMSRNFSAIRDGIADDPELASQVRFLSISFDSEFDKPEVLHNYANLYTREHDAWRFASGVSEQVDRLTKAFSVYIEREGGTFSHGLCTALVGGDGVIRKIWRGNDWQASEAVAALREMRGSLVHVAQK
jgi:protein SCO1/2